MGRAEMGKYLSRILAISFLAVGWAAVGSAADVGKSEDGKYLDADDNPAYHVSADGTVDWYTYNGFRRYHSECHVCHGPDGLGSSFAPPLSETMKTMSYDDFLAVVVNGRANVSTTAQKMMPAFGLNRNVMCYIDDLYVYLKARADGALGRGRPRKKEAKTDAAREIENSCLE